jgi:hypothetical protein
MPDHDAAPDPIDEAYVRAEAMLSDDAARAARRARVLAAVAQAPAPSLAAAVAPPAVAAPAVRRAAWRPGGWLAVACVVGLSVFLAVKVYQPTAFQPQTTPAASPSRKTPAPASEVPAPTAPTPTASTPTAPAQAAPSLKSRAIATIPAPAEPAPPPAETSARQASAAPPVEKPAAAPLAIAPIAPAPAPASAEPRAFPAAAPPPPPVVASEQAESPRTANYPASVSGGATDETAKVQGTLSVVGARRAAFAAAPVASMPQDQSARLRAAAAAGRTAEVVDLLDHGAPVDAPDAAGDTALIKSIQADHPTTAAALRRHGASLDHKNHAGKSARDVATTKEDPELDQAIGVTP